MNYHHHHGNVTGDLYAQINTAMNMGLMRCAELLHIGAISPLDAPIWLNTGRTVNCHLDGTDDQFQQHQLRDGL